MKANKGYVTAEEVIGVRNPTYDEDNIAFETFLVFPFLRVPLRESTGSITRLEQASRAMIQRGLARIQ